MNWRSKDNSDHSIVKISKDNQKCPGDLRILVVTYAARRPHQLKFADNEMIIRFSSNF